MTFIPKSSLMIFGFLSTSSLLFRHHSAFASKPSSLIFPRATFRHACSSDAAFVHANSLATLSSSQAPDSIKARGRVWKMSTKDSSAQNESVGLSDAAGITNRHTADKDAVIDWKSRIDVSIAKSRKIRGSNYVQISTVDHTTMEPRCRTVVFRGFMMGVPINSSGYGDVVMKMITDIRSGKVNELKGFHEKGGDRNNVEMVWWFPKSSEQYRIRGKLQFIGNEGPLYSYNESADEICNNKEYFIAERKQQWGNLSDMAREQFYWEEPGISYTSTWAESKDVPAGGRDEDGKVLPPPDTFLLMLLYPTAIDYLRLGDNFRQVDRWNDGQWSSKRVNP